MGDSGKLDIRYCLEEDLPRIFSEIAREAQITKQKINVIPQFVGKNPFVYMFGSYEKEYKYYKSIILMPLPAPPGDSTSFVYNFSQDPVVPVSFRDYADGTVPG